MAELKPCPFCGGKAEDEKRLMCDKTDWYNCKLRRIISDLPVDVKNVPNGCWRDAE